jgi:hypothetical protein
MRKLALLLPAVLCLSVLSGRAAAGVVAVPGAMGAWAVPFPPAPAATVTGMQDFLRTDMGAGLLSQIPSLACLQHLTVENPAHLALAGAIGLPAGFDARVAAAVRSNDPKELAAVTAVVAASYHAHGAEQALGDAVAARAADVLAQVNAGALDVSGLSAASSELAAFASLPGVGETVGVVARMAEAARAENGIASAQRIASEIAGRVAAVEAPGAAVAAPEPSRPKLDGRVAVAEVLVAELRGSDDADYGRSVMDRLVALTVDSPNETVDRIVARGIVAELRGTDDADYGRHAIAALEGVAVKTPFAGVRRIVVDGLMAEVKAASDVEYSNDALDAVERVASASADKELKGAAIALMMREIKSASDTDYIDGIQARIDRLAASEGGLQNIPVPSVLVPAPVEPSAPAAPGESLGRQLSIGVKAHPVGAFFGLLALANTVWIMAAGALPPLAILGAAAILFYLGMQGLRTHHPVAGFFQLLVVGGLFETAAHLGLALTLGSGLALLVAGGLGAALAIWSFKNDRPVLGFFLNVVLMWACTAVVFGPAAAGKLLSVTLK